ncbi:MAG: hypothetical protein KDA60_07820, partial [Planctomycetales bacterium]|nr:hypothetical protein [Planctomycetales bacterium]
MATPPSDDPLADPRVLAARRRLQSAQVDLAAKEKMMAERTAGAGNVLSAAWLRHNVGHWMLLSLGFALASGAALWCYYLLNTVFVAGRAVAMGTGMFCGFVASYTSQYFLASLQATFDGNVELDELSVLNWKEWFWTLPSTLGMFAWGLILGYIVSLAMPGYR